MQAPAVTREYQAALLQLVRSSDQEIAQRKTSARRFYGIAAGEDEGRFLAQLRAVEPSNAETLAAAFDRQRSLRAGLSRGTDGSNPASSSGESVSLPELLLRVENPGFSGGGARLAWRPGRQRRAGCYKMAPTGGNISVAPYSSTQEPRGLSPAA